MPTSKPTPPQIDLAEDWLEYSAQNHGQRLEILRFSFAASVAVLVLRRERDPGVVAWIGSQLVCLRRLVKVSTSPLAPACA
jgi:alpha/beta superfamily hydrolase